MTTAIAEELLALVGLVTVVVGIGTMVTVVGFWVRSELEGRAKAKRRGLEALRPTRSRLG